LRHDHAVEGMEERQSMADTPVDRVLWFIDGHYREALDLDRMAAVAGVSRFHLCRAFAAATGGTVTARLREVRLHAAARLLAAGAPDILSVALDCGYGSHAAFTRAFRDRFGVTPVRFRTAALAAPLRHSAVHNVFSETAIMQPTIIHDLPPPRTERTGPLRIAGLSSHYDISTIGTIPALWQKLVMEYEPLPGRLDGVSLGVCYAGDAEGGFDYLAGAQVTGFDGLPEELTRLELPARNYLVFAWPGHISEIRNLVHTIWNHWLPTHGVTPARAPDFERYPESFDGATGDGGYEIWIPLDD
jgi:AraC family transcriptional regulator